MANNRNKSKFKSLMFYTMALIFGFSIVFAIAEGLARAIEPKVRVKGDAIHPLAHPELGWVPTAGKSFVTNPEFSAVFNVNSFGMNDRPVGESINTSRVKIIAVGDSHTFAAGVSQHEAWPNVLEENLFDGNVGAGTVYNLAVSGYSLGQYLLRIRSLQDVLKPQIVIIGFSMATDLYDLIPPNRGGFVSYKDYGRVFHDLDKNGDLIEIRNLAGKNLTLSKRSKIRSPSLIFRGLAGKFAIYRRFNRSKLAFWIALNYQPEGQSLWPGMDTALKIRLSEDDAYRWRLAEKILKKIAVEAHQRSMEVVLVNIPYLAQVYDEVWYSSFGTKPEKYERWIAGRRLEKICKRIGIHYVDTTKGFVDEARRRSTWLHFKKNGHPTAEGHRLIAEIVAFALKKNVLLKQFNLKK